MAFASKVGQSECLCRKKCFWRYFHCIFSFKILVITEQGSAAFALVVCKYPLLGKHHHKCNDLDDDEQQDLCSLVMTFPCRVCICPLPHLRSHSVPTRRCCLQVGSQSAVSLVSAWDMKSVFIQLHLNAGQSQNLNSMSLWSYYKGILLLPHCTLLGIRHCFMGDRYLFRFGFWPLHLSRPQ